MMAFFDVVELRKRRMRAGCDNVIISDTIGLIGLSFLSDLGKHILPRVVIGVYPSITQRISRSC